MVLAEKNFYLKDMIFNRQSTTKLADLIMAVHPSFNKEEFVKRCLYGFKKRELKERIIFIRETLYDYLPKDVEKACTVILHCLPDELDPNKEDDDFGDFSMTPLSDYVAHYACEKKYLKKSFALLLELTKRFSVEYSIRHFINKFPKETFLFLKKCARDKNYHVRRLASEGCRPKLPWAQKIVYKNDECIPILESLYNDKTSYVRRSVANHLNDISKTDPEIVILLLKKWKSNTKNYEQLVKHSLRTLIRNNNKQALLLLGYSPKPLVTAVTLRLKSAVVKIGENLNFNVTLESKSEQSLIINYVVHYVSSSNKSRKKVFKLTEGSFTKGQTIFLEKKQSFKKMTTRSLFRGEHTIELQINGNSWIKKKFQLL